MPEIANNEELLSVGQLNNIAKELLEGHLANVSVVAEISNLSIPSSGHMYFTLKDDTGSVRCAFFKGKQFGLNFKPKDGDQCIVNAQVSLYVPRGDYQLIVNSIEPYGAGNLMAAYEKLKTKLHQEGLFNAEHKKKYLIGQDILALSLLLQRQPTKILLPPFKEDLPLLR